MRLDRRRVRTLAAYVSTLVPGSWSVVVALVCLSALPRRASATRAGWP